MSAWHLGEKPAVKSAESMRRLRERREAQGLYRRELYATDADWAEIQAFHRQQQRKRSRKPRILAGA